MEEARRCPWARGELDIAYHDREWGRPCHDEARLFELLILEGMQAGLSWSLILKRREALRRALDNFDPQVLARYTDDDLAAKLEAEGMIRNRRKLLAARQNAQAYLRLRESGRTLDDFLWSFTGGQIIVNHPKVPEDVPATSEESHKMSRALKELGFSFVGPTICYALMQSMGMVNDHMVWCDFRGDDNSPEE